MLNHPIKRGVNHIRLSTVTRHITLTVCRMQYFYYFKKQKQKRLTKRCRTTILKVFSYYNSIASSINPQILNLISSKLIKFVCDCDIKREKGGRDGGHRLSVRSTQRIRQGQRPPRQTLPQTRPQRYLSNH